MSCIKPNLINCPIQNLPQETLSTIFSRLSVNSILSCKYVCKFWCSIIRNPDFLRSYESVEVLIRPYGDGQSNTNLHLADPEGDYVVKKRNKDLSVTLGFKSVIKFHNHDYKDFDNVKIINCCKGFVCLTGSRRRCYSQPPCVFVCNPITSDYVVVKQLTDWPLRAGFGFSTKSGEYKLIRCYYYYPMGLMAQVYTLGRDKDWRIVDDCPQVRDWCVNGWGKCTYFKGSLYWIIGDQKTRTTSICAFDCDEEIFRVMDLPDVATHMQLGVFQSRLCFSFRNSRDRFWKDCEIWVMDDECGVKESWKKLFVVSSGESNINLMPLKPLAYMKNGEILMLSVRKKLVSYDMRSNTWRAVEIHGLTGKVEAMLFDPTFQPAKSLFKKVEPLKIIGID